MQAIIDAKSLKRIIQATKRFTGNGVGGSPLYQFIKLDFVKEFNSVKAVAVDGYRLSVENALCSSVDSDFSAYILPDIPKSKASDWAAIEVEDGVCYIKIGDSITGYKQPSGDFLDYNKTVSDITVSVPNFKIGFNGNLLLSAIQSAQASCGGSFKQPIVLEFRGAQEPVIIRTNENDIKLVLPVRLKE